MTNPTTYRCPRCGHAETVSTSRTCAGCGYHGDWVQPGQVETYAERHGRCPCTACSTGSACTFRLVDCRCKKV